MSGLAVAAALAAGLSVWWGCAPPRPVAAPPVEVVRDVSTELARVAKHRPVLALVAASAGVTLVGGGAGVVVSLVLAGAVWRVAGQVASPHVRRDREAIRADLPHLVQLLGIALAAGDSVPGALASATQALPGPAAAALLLARWRLAVGVPPEVVWRELARRPGLEPLGLALARADASGARVSAAVERLAADLARDARTEVEDRARAVGIRAAVPLGVCFLPAFLLVGIVPVVAAGLASLAW
jgi:Flp pilus assembly protein TadB